MKPNRKGKMAKWAKRTGFGVLLAWSLNLSMPMMAHADDWALNTVTDFGKIAQQAKKDRQPIAIYFNRVRCGACEKLKEMAILPMIENGHLDGYVHMVEIRVDEKDVTTGDFYGEQVENRYFQELYNVTSFPSIVFVNEEGDEIGTRMENSGAYDYVPYRLRKMINEALAEMGNKKRMEE